MGSEAGECSRLSGLRAEGLVGTLRFSSPVLWHPCGPGRGCEREISLKMRHLLKAAFPSGTGSLPSSSLYRGWFSSPDITGQISTVPNAGEKTSPSRRAGLPGGNEPGSSALLAFGSLQNYHHLSAFFQRVTGWQRLAAQLLGEKQTEAARQGFNHTRTARSPFSSLPGAPVFVHRRSCSLNSIPSTLILGPDPCWLLQVGSVGFPPVAVLGGGRRRVSSALQPSRAACRGAAALASSLPSLPASLASSCSKGWKSNYI